MAKGGWVNLHVKELSSFRICDQALSTKDIRKSPFTSDKENHLLHYMGESVSGNGFCSLTFLDSGVPVKILSFEYRGRK